MCKYNIDIVDDDQSIVLEDVELPSLIEPAFNKDPEINEDDMDVFYFNEDEEISISSIPSLITLKIDDLSISCGDVIIEEEVTLKYAHINTDEILHDENDVDDYLSCHSMPSLKNNYSDDASDSSEDTST